MKKWLWNGEDCEWMDSMACDMEYCGNCMNVLIYLLAVKKGGGEEIIIPLCGRRNYVL